MRRLLLIVGLLGGVAGVARGQESLDFVSADRETAAQLTQILESVKAADLPTEPVIAKARLAMRRFSVTPRARSARRATRRPIVR